MATRRKKPTREVIELARQLFERYLRDVETARTEDDRDDDAFLKEHGRRFASIGGRKRAESLSPREVIELARQLFERYLRDVETARTEDDRDDDAFLKEHGRRFASIGGRKRAEILSRARRREIARKAGQESGKVRAARARARKEAAPPPANSEPIVNSTPHPKK